MATPDFSCQGLFPAAGPSVCWSSPAARGSRWGAKQVLLPAVGSKDTGSPGVQGTSGLPYSACLLGGMSPWQQAGRVAGASPFCQGRRSGGGIGNYTMVHQADKAASTAGAHASPQSEFPDVANISRSPLDTHLHTQAGAHAHTQAGAHTPAHACL